MFCVSILAWKYFQKGQYKEALKCLEDVDTTCGSSTQVSYIKLLQGNCHLLLVSFCPLLVNNFH